MTAWRYLRNAVTVGALLALVVVVATFSIQTSDVIFLPSPAEAIDPHVVIAGHPRKPHRGMFYITFVNEQQANLLTEFYYSHFDPQADVVPLQSLYGPEVPSPQQQRQQAAMQMMDSQTSAEVAAFRALGYRVALHMQVTVAGVTRQSKAYGKLRVGDVILSADGHAVHAPGDLTHVVQSLRPGQAVRLLVRRGAGARARTFALTVSTIAAQGGRKAVIGISIASVATVDPHSFPFKVTIDVGDIGGPSAGLMFALSIINRLSDMDLTHGYKIAGTGTIDADGNVGPIGGAKQKVIGAREAGARYFFVPAYCTRQVCNSREARPYARGITLVPVSTLGDALAYLRHLR